MPIALVVHGGAWDIPDDEVVPHRDGCRRACDVGWQVLQAGGSALDAVEAAVRVMEDDPIFDAGTGSVLNVDGIVECDAAIMDGDSLHSGAIAAVQRVRDPIALARRVLASQVVLLVGAGAERFADAVGHPRCAHTDLIVPREVARWHDVRARLAHEARQAFERPIGEVAGRGIVVGPTGTVGAVALDLAGHLAAATSTGGTGNKPAGRVGDSPIVGSGLYADDETAACSTTGWGESIVRVVLARTATELVGRGMAPPAAAAAAIEILARRGRGLGGCILLDRGGRIGFAFNTPRMAYAYRSGDGVPVDGV